MADKLDKGPLSLEEAVKVVSQLAPALDVAHKRGIIHRDMKPANILFDRYGDAYLSDFGIARVTQAAQTLTGENVLGTPSYMSPEQVHGDKDLDGRCDLYALGIIFYQMLVGSVPFQATTPAKVMMMQVLDPVPSFLDTGLDLPDMLEVWLEKAMAKDPEDRFANALDMLDALKDAVQGHEHHTLKISSKKVGDKSNGATVRQQPLTVVTESKQSKGKYFRLGAFVVIGLAVITLGIFGFLGKGPLAMLSPASPTESILEPANTELAPVATVASISISPTATQQSLVVATMALVEPTETLAPTETLVPTATSVPEVLTMGGADKIAFFNNNDIWVVNIDGSDLQQLTEDGSEKHDLSWGPNGEILYYILGKCIWSLELESGRLDYVACFETARFLEAFVISPDGEQVAISLNRELFIVPFDKERLREARYHTDLKEMSECAAFSPWLTIEGKARAVEEVRWAQDMKSISVLMLSAQGNIQGDIIMILGVDDCNYQPNRLDEFPGTRFPVAQYEASPYLQNFAYDGAYLYALTSYTRNDGYGYLYFYNADLHRANLEVDPIGGGCCYRDPAFSPDGRYLIFAYQPFEAGAMPQLYYIHYASIGTGASYEPIPLPEGFFTDTLAKPQPVLRPASGQE
ncbi:MAG: hypothetical protein B6243_09265 [Anaerolineaceae bacterium 4572_5.2]|nr:MAG: hypothetical protein B6243_09265 [Anaerolineaceae bacterium 4572_5.2]